MSPNPITDRTEKRFRTDIQGLRAIAVAVVVLYHAGLPLPGGYVGVDVFFVISGFLITGHLLASLRGTGRIDFAAFFARRARRILPASLVVLLLTVVAAFLFVSPLRLKSILGDAIATALYVPNLRFATQETDYLAASEPSPFQHYWSLGVEEQFYLLWPLVLLGLFLAVRRSARMLGVAIAILALVSFAAGIIVAGSSEPWAFFSLPTRAWELLVGGLVAAFGLQPVSFHPMIAAIGGWLGLALIVAASVTFGSDTPTPGFATTLPVIGAAAVILFGSAPSRWGPSFVLGLRPLQFLGVISYSLYLVHWPILVLAAENAAGGDRLTPATTSMLALGCVPLAWLLYRFVEAPMMGTGRATDRPRRTLLPALAASVLLAVSLTGAGAAVALVPLDSGRPAASTPIRPSPAGTGFVPTNLTPTLEGAVADTGAVYTNGCQQTIDGAAAIRCTFGDPDAEVVVALFGDSHAGRWFPALEKVAETRGFRLDTYLKSRCRSEEQDTLWTNAENESCSTWRTNVLTTLHEDPPDVIVLTNHLGPLPDRKPSDVEAEWLAASLDSFARLPAPSKIVVIADTPEFPASPVPCLSSHLDDALACSADRDEVLNPSIAAGQFAASVRSETGFLDFTDYLCDARSCPAIIGRDLVYSDDHHLTATFSRRMASVLGEALEPFLPAR